MAGRSKALAVLAVLSLLWGYSWIVAKIALDYAGPFAFASLRTALAALCLFALLAATGRPLRPTPLRSTLVLGLTQTTAFLSLSTWALVEAGAGKVAVLVFTMPFWTLLFAWPALRERITGLQWLAVGVALAGLTLILEPWGLRATLFSKTLALLAGGVWSVSTVYAKRIQARSPTDVLELTAWQMLLGGVPLLILAWAVPERSIEWAPVFIGALLFHSVLTTALGWLMWLYVLRALPAGTASMNSLAIPVIALLAGWLQLGERPTPAELSGMLLIAAALALLSWHGLRPRPGQAAGSAGESRVPPILDKGRRIR